MKTIIHNGKLICGDIIIPTGYIGIENGVIIEIGTGDVTKKTTVRHSESNAHWIDAEGCFVSPGFIDLHVHGVGVCDLYKDTVKGLKRMAKILASQGVTSFLPTIITAPINKILEAISAIKTHAKEINGANILGINLEGPFINPEKRGAHPLKDIKSPNILDLKSIIDAGEGFLKIMTIAPELPGALDLVNLLKENEVIPAIGHTMASFEETNEAINKGFSYITHTFNAMTPFHHRNPGAIGAIMLHKEVITEIIADGNHLHPAIVRLICQIRNKDRIMLITDALTGIMRKGDKAEFADEEVECTGAGAYNTKDILMGSTVPMNKAIYNVPQFTDLSLTSAIKLATINPANVLGVSNKKGSIEIGKDADIVILGDDFSVKTTLVGGKVI